MNKWMNEQIIRFFFISSLLLLLLFESNSFFSFFLFFFFFLLLFFHSLFFIRFMLVHPLSIYIYEWKIKGRSKPVRSQLHRVGREHRMPCERSWIGHGDYGHHQTPRRRASQLPWCGRGRQCGAGWWLIYLSIYLSMCLSIYLSTLSTRHYAMNRSICLYDLPLSIYSI